MTGAEAFELVPVAMASVVVIIVFTHVLIEDWWEETE